MLIPGVSGGSVAIMLGIYDKLLLSVSSLFSDFKRNAYFLAKIAIGGMAGALLCAGLVSSLLNVCENEARTFFCGLALGISPVLWSKAKIREFKPKYLLALPVLASIAAIKFLPMFDSATTTRNVFSIFFYGIILAIALVLPGISFSHMLILFKLYQPFYAAIKGFDLFFLLPMGLGIITGTYLFSLLFERIYRRHGAFTNILIIGVLIISVAETLPINFICTSPILFTIVFLSSFALSYLVFGSKSQ